MKLPSLLLLSLVGLQACTASTPDAAVDVMAQANAPATFQNPVISGFHPDPSVTRVGEDYYLVNSSFEWFPGIPIFHSKDLVNWRQIGHALTRPSQLKMKNNKASSGVWAPTIRYHDGTYYVIVTCKQCGNNFYVTADKPEGPYSDPIRIDTPQGIDPSLFFDDDGKVWFSANRFPEKPAYDSQHIVYTQEIDIKTGKLKGPRYDLTDGQDCGKFATEGPHHYKVGNTYYLLTAEGMTWEKHAVCMYSSDQVSGPYTLLPGNPVLSHRDKPNSPFQHTGHADLVQTQNGDWWSVLLAVRKIGKDYYLGRETLLTPVEWKDGIPVFGSKPGEVQVIEPRPNLPWTPWAKQPATDEFNEPELGLDWNYLRTPMSDWLRIEKSQLILPLRPEVSTQSENPSLIARRFEHFDFEALTQIQFKPLQDGEEAGIIAIQNDRFQYRLVITQEQGKAKLKLIKVFNVKRKVLTETVVFEKDYLGESLLGFEIHGMDIQFKVGTAKEKLVHFGKPQNANVLTSNIAGGFIGAYVGMYASSNGKTSNNEARFDWFSYQPLPATSQHIDQK